MEIKKEVDEVPAVDILANVLAVVFDESKSAEEIREQVRLILEKA